MVRPSYRETDRKLSQAKEAAVEKRIAFLQQEVIYTDLLDLDMLVHDLIEKLPMILSEINPENYQGQRPPAKSYKQPILDCDLFAFRWYSKIIGCQMYLKFTFKDGMLWIVSFHRHREKNRGEP